MPSVPGGEASLLLNLEAPFTIGIAVLFFGESLVWRELLGAAAVILGGVILASSPGESGVHVLGALAVAGAGLAWAIDNNLSQRLSLRDPVAVTRVKTLVEMNRHQAVACASTTDMTPNKAEAQQHVAAMTQWAGHAMGRSHDLASMAGMKMGGMMGSGSTTGQCIHNADGSYTFQP